MAATQITSFGPYRCLLLLLTAQSGDRLLLNGKEFFFYTNPWAPFLEQNPRLRAEAGTDDDLQLAVVRSYVGGHKLSPPAGRD